MFVYFFFLMYLLIKCLCSKNVWYSFTHFFVDFKDHKVVVNIIANAYIS